MHILDIPKTLSKNTASGKRCYASLRRRSTFRYLLCFRKVFLECGMSVLFFTFLVLLNVFFLLHHCVHSRAHALTVACTHNDTRALIISLITPEDENTVFISLYLGTLLSVPFSRDVGGFRSNGIYRSNPE